MRRICNLAPLIFLAGALGALAARPAFAQPVPVLRGQLVLADSVTRAAGVIVAGSDASGAVVGRTLSGTLGEFRLELPRPGRYVVRALRVGYRPTVLPPVDLAAGEERVLRIVLQGEAVSLAAVRVRGDNVCRIRQDSGQAVAQLWEEARKVLTATQLSTASRTLEARVVVFDRTTNVSGTTVLADRTSVKEGPTERPFAAMSPDSLARYGYVREQPDSSVVYDAPDADALLSDQFAALHCFHVTPSTKAHPEWVGVAFKPARERSGIDDIEGILWIDRSTAELRRIEFAYTNLPDEFKGAAAGGFVEFVRLSTGQWLVSRWTIRMPRAHYVTETRFASGALSRASVRRLVIDGLQLAGGDVTSVTRGGVELYHAGVVTAVVAAPPPPSIAGELYDSLARGPLRAAVVHLQDLARSTRSDSLGRFRFDSVPSGEHLLWIDHPRLDSLGLHSLSVELEVRAEGENSAFLTVASFAMLWRRACGSAPVPTADSGLVFGHVTREAGVPLDSAAIVEASWNEPPGVDVRARLGAPVVLRAQLGADEAFALCGVPTRERIALRASQGTFATPSMALRVGETRVAQRDLTLTDPATMRLLALAGTTLDTGATAASSAGSATIAGTVADAGGRPIPDARVMVAGVAETVTTDANGRYARRDLPGGSRTVSIQKIGYGPVLSIADLYPLDSVTVDARMTRVTTLATVNVNERQRKSALVTEINTRIAGAPGRFVDSTKIAKMAGLWQAFEQPSLTVDRNSAGGFRVIVRKVPLFKANVEICSPAIFIDGQQASAQDLSDISKDRIAVIETYLRGGSTPLQYMVNACGTILVWTKDFVRLP
jgi:hypothetical protein